MPWHDKAALKVLVAEDDAAILELLVTRLELAGYRTAQARDGLMALDIWPGFSPKLAILDVNMPGLDGFGVLSALRRRGHFGVPVMMLTARNARMDVERARALGAQDYMVKPFNDQDLLQRVARLAQLRPVARR